jgi:hypothetical protein
VLCRSSLVVPLALLAAGGIMPIPSIMIGG